MTHLNPKNPLMWQQPKYRISKGDNVWFSTGPVGRNKLSSLMHRLSKTYNLSKSYTNHSIRATTVTILDQADFKSRMIMKVSGHRSEFSIKNYSHRIDRKTRCTMSETLGAAVSRYQIENDLTDNNVLNTSSVNHTSMPSDAVDVSIPCPP